MTTAGPTLNALLVATALEDWPAWYGCTRLAVADYLEDRDLPGDRPGATLVRLAEPQAWAQFAVRLGWEVDEVRLSRSFPAGPLAPWVDVAVAGRGRDDDAFSRLTVRPLAPGTGVAVGGPYLRRFPLVVLRLSAVIPDESEVSAGVFLRPTAGPVDYSLRWADLRLTPWDARLWCRREVLGLFADVLVKAPCPHCGGRGITPTGILMHAAAGLKPGTVVGTPGGPLPCPVCRGRPPRPCPAPSLLPTPPAVALPALAPVN